MNCYLLALLVFVALALPHPTSSNTFGVANNSWTFNDEPLVIRSGSLHYFRLPAAQWDDRIKRMKAMGLNAVTFYVPWNYHELDFEGVSERSERTL